jgi:hypothetical protein
MPVILLKDGAFISISDLQVAVVDFQLQGAERLTIDIIFGIARSPIGSTRLETAIWLLGGENLR